jgi:hypothetical protein
MVLATGFASSSYSGRVDTMPCGINCETVDQLLDWEVLQFSKMVGIFFLED